MASTVSLPWPRLFARIFVGGLLFLGMGCIAAYEFRRLDRLAELEAEKSAVVGAQVGFFGDVLHRIRADLIILSRQTELDAAKPGAADLAALAREYAEFVHAVGRYASIRLLGTDDRDLINVSADEDGGIHVFIESPGEAIADGDILARARHSAASLLMTGEVAREKVGPRPVLRFSIVSPATDPADRKLLEATYRADAMFHRLSLIASRSDSSLILVTGNGYWQAEPGPEGSVWQYHARSPEAPLSQAYPDAWQRVIREESGIVRVRDGFFVFRTVHPAIQGFWGFSADTLAPPTPEAAEWRVVSFVSPETTAALENRILETLVPSALAALLAWGLISWALAVYWSSHHHRQARLLHQATVDPLTGALNRAAFDDRFGAALFRYAETGETCAVIFADLDAFKAVNDTYGHDAGDACLRETVARIRAAIRDDDIVARVGGDEFAVLLSPVKGRAAAVAVRDKIAASLASAPAPYGDAGEPIRASLGLAVCPADGTTAEMLLRTADKDMYGAKRGRPADSRPEDLPN